MYFLFAILGGILLMAKIYLTLRYKGQSDGHALQTLFNGIANLKEVFPIQAKRYETSAERSLRQQANFIMWSAVLCFILMVISFFLASMLEQI